MIKKFNAIDTSGLVKRTDYDNKISDIEAVISTLVKKADYDAKISNIEKKYVLLLLIITNLRMKYLMQR